MEVSIIRVEGLQKDLNTTGCYVSVDNRLYDVITPLSADNPEAAVELPSSGQLRLIIKNMAQDHDVIGSVSVGLDLLPESGFCWLPIYENLEEDQVFDFDQEFQPPRVLISVNETEAYLLPKIDEISSNPATPIDTMKPLELKPVKTGFDEEHWVSRVNELENKLKDDRWKFQQELGSLKEDMLAREQDSGMALSKLEQENLDKGSEIERINRLLQLKDAKAHQASETLTQCQAQLEERNSEIEALREALAELQLKQSEALCQETVLTNFSKEEFQQTLDDLVTQNKELQNLYELADNDRQNLEEQLKEASSNLELEVNECIGLERYNAELKDQVKHLTEELKLKRPRSREPSLDRLIDNKRPDNSKEELTKLKLKVEELKDSLKELTSQNEVLAEELDYTQSSLKEQNIKVERLVKENEALNDFKTEVERSTELKDVFQADVEFKEFIAKRGLDRIIQRQGEGEYVLADYFLKTYKRNCVFAVEAHGGMQIVEELIKLALKAESTRSRQTFVSQLPVRRSSASSGAPKKANSHRRTNTEQLDLSLSDKSKAGDISYISVSKEDPVSKPSKVRKTISRPVTSRKDNENIPCNGKVESDHDQTPSKSLFKSTVASKSKLRAPASTTPTRERVQRRASRVVERVVHRVPFK